MPYDVARDRQRRLVTCSHQARCCIQPAEADGSITILASQDGTILTGATVANLAFGGRNPSRLFICASQSLLAVDTHVCGAQRP